MNSRISYSFILKPTPNKQGLNPVYIRAFLHGQKSEIATSVSIPALHWDEKSQRVRRSNPAHEQFNTIIDLFDQKALKYILRNFIHSEAAPTLTQFKAYMTDTAATPSENFTDYILQYLKENRSRLSAASYESYKSQITKLQKFKNPIAFADIDEHFINRYREYMLDKLHNCLNTAGKSLRTLRTFINIAERRGIIRQNPFKYITVKRVEGRRDCLTKEELLRLEELYYSQTITDKSERQVLRYFLFACYTGLRYSDLKLLKPSHIKENKLTLRMHKTGLSVIVPLSERARRILGEESAKGEGTKARKHEGAKERKNENTRKRKNEGAKGGKGEGAKGGKNEGMKEGKGESRKGAVQKIFKVYCNKTTNRTLQAIGKRYAIGRHLTCHVARHTFATVSLQLGIPIEVVSKLLGHTNLKTTQLYAKIVDEVKVREMGKWDVGGGTNEGTRKRMNEGTRKRMNERTNEREGTK